MEYANNSCRILVVDDNRDAAEMVALLFASFGHITATAFDGVEAIAVATRFLPDVVFLDINLPNKDGCETAIELRMHSSCGKAKLIALTAIGDAAGLTRIRNTGFDALLCKPVSVDDLLMSIG
jgi:CheY-like chemotaxis protein